MGTQEKALETEMKIGKESNSGKDYIHNQVYTM